MVYEPLDLYTFKNVGQDLGEDFAHTFWIPQHDYKGLLTDIKTLQLQIRLSEMVPRFPPALTSNQESCLQNSCSLFSS